MGGGESATLRVWTWHGVRLHGGGSGDGGRPVLLLLHGMGATGDVWYAWSDLLASRWPGRWLAPDLPGHGGSAPLDEYTFDSLAAAVAEVLDPGDRVVVLGHSLGGVVGLALAARLGDHHGVGATGGANRVGATGGADRARVEAVVGLGVKVAWSPDELAKAAALAGRPVAWYDSRDEAVRRHLRVSGLADLLTVGDSRVDAGLRVEDGRWRLAMDPRCFAVGDPEMVDRLARVPVPVLLARGEHDPMVGDADLAAFGIPVRTLAGLGHNAHVEDPVAVAALLEPYGLMPAR
ncbi:alpha/beta fold hydrolase [Plantactinospora sp. B5E13]|uniref:alpha/beta fold hydrolase n=1 Tax=Plantactinospora sp. B5E13 TaxID=3153758 RepID=UPI00325D049A